MNDTKGLQITEEDIFHMMGLLMQMEASLLRKGSESKKRLDMPEKRVRYLLELLAEAIGALDQERSGPNDARERLLKAVRELNEEETQKEAVESPTSGLSQKRQVIPGSGI